MKNDNLEGYINGLAEMASVLSDKIGFSMMNVMRFDRADFEEEFLDATGLEVFPDLYQTDETLEDLFKEIFGTYEDARGMKLAAGLLHLLKFRLGDPAEVLRFVDMPSEREAASSYSGGWGPFYFMEDMFFVQFDEDVLLFMVGNDE